MEDIVILNFVIAVLLAMVTALLIRRYLFFVTKVSSLSMYPLLKPKQRLLTKYLQSFNNLKRGEIIVFYSYELKQDLIKRVIGLPRDIVDIRKNGTVYLNQKKLDETYVKNPGGSSGIFIVPEGKYFMLGDNRALSKDSRHFKDPFISQKDIIGKAFLSIYPIHGL
ncbi:MAG: signal peptidase I [Clostridiaceae bacterium]